MATTKNIISKRLLNFSGATVWQTFTPLAIQHKAVNLGQGFPGWSPPKFVQDAATRAINQTGYDFMANQYARSEGNLLLVNKLASIYSNKMNRPVDAMSNIVITNGATEGICDVMLGLLNAGDEVVAFEPAFDIYWAQADMCEAKIRTVPLYVEQVNEKKRWTFNMETLEKAFNEKTKIFILNTPHNPTGKVFTMEELQEIRKLILKYPNVVVIADEVYEYMCFDQPHISFASLEGMWDRTITISSAGKTFSTTGWKIGWCVAPQHLVRCAAVSHQWVAFSVATPLQIAIAEVLDEAEKPYEGFENYYAWLAHEYRHKRDLLAESLREAGIEPIIPEGGFFIIGDTSKIQVPADQIDVPTESRDWQVCRWLTQHIGVASIPPSPFYCDANKPLAYNYARFATCKPDAVLLEAKAKLMQLKNYKSQQQ